MIYKEKPQDFKKSFEVVSCFCEYEGKILLLQRDSKKSEGDKWGAPAGKVDVGESLTTAMIRELFEETGMLAKADDLVYQNKLYVRYPDYDFIYHTFHWFIPSLPPEIMLSPREHQRFQWLSPDKAVQLPLVLDMEECIRMFYDL